MNRDDLTRDLQTRLINHQLGQHDNWGSHMAKEKGKSLCGEAALEIARLLKEVERKNG